MPTKLLISAALAMVLALLVPPSLAQDATPAAPSAAPAPTNDSAPAPNGTAPASPSSAAPDANTANPPPGAAVEADAGRSDGVAAVVNDAVITEYDLRQRELLFISTSGLQPTPEVMSKLREQVLKQLETEQLQIQEARRKNITVSPVEVDKMLDKITADNRLTKDQLGDMLGKNGVNIATLRAQIAVQIAWQKAVQDEFEGRVNISPQDIDAEMLRLEQGANRPHFLVSSIFLAVDNPDLDGKVLKDANDIHAQLAAGANFATVARQFSQSPTAATGGDLGWVYQGQLPTEVDQELQKMQIGQVSEPIRSAGGYYIVGLRDRAEAANATLPDPAKLAPTGPLTVDRILLPLGPKPPKELMDNAMKIAQQIREHINGCGDLPKIQEQVHGMVVQDVAKMGLKITDLDQRIQDAIAKAGPGEATVPFVSEAGIELMVRCDTRPPEKKKWTTPSRQQVEENLFDDQITMLSRRYMRDLRRNANVETK